MLIDKKRVYASMDRHGLDLLVATSPANVTYLSDFRAVGNDILGSYVFVVFARDPNIDPTTIVPKGEASDLLGLKMSWIRDVRTYGTFHVTVPDRRLSGWHGRLAKLLREETENEPLLALKRVLDEKGGRGRTIGVDERFFTGENYNKLLAVLEGSTVRPAYEIFREIRAVKNREEIETITRVNGITEKGIGAVLESLRLGMKGSEMVALFNKTVMHAGALPLATSISLGEDSYLQNNYSPPQGRLRKGDLVRFDVLCLYNNHFADIGRNAVLGRPTKLQSRYYNAVLQGEENAIRAIMPGVKASEVFRAGVEGARRGGIKNFERHHCGHGIGLELYERPLITPSNDEVIEEGSVINIETPYYEMGVGGFMVEDTLLVTKQGVKFLTGLGRELYVSPA